MNDDYFDYRVRDLLSRVECRRVRLIVEGVFDGGGAQIATPRQWDAWRRRQAKKPPSRRSIAGTIQSGVPAPSVRVRDPAGFVEVVFPRAVGYRERKRRLPQPAENSDQRSHQDRIGGVVELEHREVTEVSLVLDQASPFEATVIDPAPQSEPAGHDANNRVIASTPVEGLGLRIPIELGERLLAYQPSALIVIDQPSHPDDPLHLLVESGTTEHDDRIDSVMRSLWLPAVNRAIAFGRWDYVRLEGEAESRDDQLYRYLDALTRDESSWDWLY